jgi:hypothetical protein
MFNTVGATDNASLPSKCPIDSKNPPNAITGDSADRRNNKDLPIEPLSN